MAIVDTLSVGVTVLQHVTAEGLHWNWNNDNFIILDLFALNSKPTFSGKLFLDIDFKFIETLHGGSPWIPNWEAMQYFPSPV